MMSSYNLILSKQIFSENQNDIHEYKIDVSWVDNYLKTKLLEFFIELFVQTYFVRIKIKHVRFCYSIQTTKNHTKLSKERQFFENFDFKIMFAEINLLLSWIPELCPTCTRILFTFSNLAYFNSEKYCSVSHL